jgi:hypothetical protein
MKNNENSAYTAITIYIFVHVHVPVYTRYTLQATCIHEHVGL